MGGGEVLRKGWLIKSPPLDSGGIKAWRKRYFQLRSSKILEYYKVENGNLKGVINLEDCKAVNSDLFHKKHKYVFDIQTHDRVYYLVAKSSEEMTSWVDALCNLCGFTLKSLPAGSELSQTMGGINTSKNDAVISPPVSTLPTNVSGSLLSERFGTEECQNDVYSLATAAIYDVQTKLGQNNTAIPAGTSLTDALTAKGMAPSPYNSVYSQATPLPENAYFSPRTDVSSLYAVPVKKSKLPKQQSVDTATKALSPKHQPLSATKSNAETVSRSLSSEKQSPLTTTPIYRPAEMMANGYMRPSEWTGSSPRPPNYSYVSGPPRPADASPNTHHSALLRREDEPTPSDGYVNLKALRDELAQVDTPPQINRSTKPGSDSSPSIQRHLKPGSITEEESPPSTPIAVDATDIPRPTRKTMKYSQINFNPESGQLCLVDDSPPAPDPALRAPIPKPRKRVNYSDINIRATTEMAAATPTEEPLKRLVSLNEAEIASLAEKPYVNVMRDGVPDEDTDPDYYTHMRDLPADSLLHVLMTRQGNEVDEDLYQEPRKTSNS